MKRLFIAVIALTLFSTAAFAHNGMVHVMGTVTATTDKSISVKGTDGKTQTVMLMPTTKFSKADKSATIKDVQVGDHIVIHSTKRGDQLLASEVKIGAMAMKGMSGDMKGMKMDHPAISTPH